MSVYSDLKYAVDEEEAMFLQDVARRQAREDDYLYERSLEQYDECDDEDYEE